AAEAAEVAHAGREEGRGRLLELPRADGLGLVERLVDAGDDEVLEHLQVAGVDDAGLDLDGGDAAGAVGGDGDHAAAHLGRDGLLLEGLLRVGHLLLHLGHAAEEVRHVGGGVHCVFRVSYCVVRTRWTRGPYARRDTRYQTISAPNFSKSARKTGCSWRSCLSRSNGSTSATVSPPASGRATTKRSAGGASLRSAPRRSE